MTPVVLVCISAASRDEPETLSSVSSNELLAVNVSLTVTSADVCVSGNLICLVALSFETIMSVIVVT